MFKLICLFALLSVAYAALARFPPQEKPAEFAKQEGCYVGGDLNRVLPYDKPYYPDGRCERYVCKKSGETLWETCGSVFIKPGCKSSEVDLSKRYPDCCAKELC